MGSSKDVRVCGSTGSSLSVADGTVCLQPTMAPGTVGVSQDRRIQTLALESALASLQATALNFGRSFINDATVRENYVRKIAEMSKEILRDVQAGRATPEEGARLAGQLRNQIMEEARSLTSALGRARAEKMKPGGKTVAQLVEDLTAKKFPGRTFTELNRAERRLIFTEIVESAGRSRPAVTSSIPRWRLMGRSCIVFTLAISTYNVWTAENKVQAGLKEGIILGGGAAGGALAGAATGLVCGPGAPFCSTALFVVGGIMGALAGVAATEFYEDELRELSEWLGDRL